MRLNRILPLLLLAACESDPLATAAMNVEVDASASTDLPVALNFQVENRGSETVYLAACDHRIVPIVQRRENGAWADTNSAICLGTVSGEPVAVRPGETAQGGGPVAGAGEYRIGLILYAQPGAEEHRTVVSDPVRIGQ